ncbi:hypothetical protein HUO13_19465 [Saccharopolyspora erythraea]|uniref:hypothetical protein n=1 Tax=Saccharopolyspora erythraea TaxID=1836 RepID=UPI001BAD8DDB|nr:hypothetical protein [Saccharopolyspora erythraea]QUH02690.1 hypothetical protein HUO13_19465 [Saccharopolyspora erythraea]
MLHTRELFESMTTKPSLSSEQMATMVEALQDCAEAVLACSAGMLAARDAGHLAEAASRDMDCVDVVTTTRNVLTRGNGPDSSMLSAQLEVCLLACERSNELCGRHAEHHTHCRICSDATRHCADTCRATLDALHR